MSELKEVARVLVYLASLYPHFQMAEATPEAYHTILADIPAETLMAAAVQVGSAGTFFPAASELRRAAMSLIDRSEGRLSGEEAWEQVCREIRESGYYRVPTFTDPIIYRAVDCLGGWKTACASENQIADRAHFLRIYDSLATRRQEDSRTLPQVRELVQRLQGQRVVKQLPGQVDDAETR